MRVSYKETTERRDQIEGGKEREKGVREQEERGWKEGGE